MSKDRTILDIERDLRPLEDDILTLQKVNESGDKTDEIANLKARRDHLIEVAFSKLDPWDHVLLARHPKRPYTLDYVRVMFDRYAELKGDRLGQDDPAMVAGLGFIDDQRIYFIGQQKGRDIQSRVLRNYGHAHPAGYRKALRVARLAESFNAPLICFIDTGAAACKKEDEANGISEAIARCMAEMSVLKTPIIAVVLGEGGSGGAIGIGVANRIMMLEYAIYSVIPPEGFADILWRDDSRRQEAAKVLRITSADALEFGFIDEIVREPLGGAHRDMEAIAANVKETLLRHIRELKEIPTPDLVDQRYQKFGAMGVFDEIP